MPLGMVLGSECIVGCFSSDRDGWEYRWALSHPERYEVPMMVTGTPRRLVLCVRAMAEKQADTIVEAIGPPEKVAKAKGSFTGRYLAPLLDRAPAERETVAAE